MEPVAHFKTVTTLKLPLFSPSGEPAGVGDGATGGCARASDAKNEKQKTEVSLPLFMCVTSISGRT
jgi:hypothetical protein